MGLVSQELNLDIKPTSYNFETINGLLGEVALMNDLNERLIKMDDFVMRLEDEFNKIQAFQNELPLSLLLLKDAIMYLNQESGQYRTRNAHQPVLEEFIPLKKGISSINNQISDNDDDSDKVDEEDSNKDKKNWMSSVQLWSSENSSTNTRSRNRNQTLVSKHLKEDDRTDKFVGVELHNPNENRSGSQCFVPMISTSYNFSEFRKNSNKDDVSVPGLSLHIPGIEHHKQDMITSGLNSRLDITAISCSASNGQLNIRSGHQKTAGRKQRRCWSPELHRRFIDALSQLGGPQAATPKQIRDLMRVDGLTNDEVKSHLQKYRIHSRRVLNTSSVSENESAGSKPSNSHSGSPEGPLQFPGFTAGTSTTGGDSMEDEDDERSESYSWKGHLQTMKE